MKTNKFMKFLLSLLIVLSINSVNVAAIHPIITANYDSQIQLLSEGPNNSPFEDSKKP